MSKSGVVQQNKPMHRISRRNTQPHPGQPRENIPHRTLDDWDKQELYERSIRRKTDLVGEWMGITFYYSEHTDLTWRDSFRDDPEVVSRFYPHEKLIVDEPETREDTLKRIDLFERLGIKYMYIDADEEIDEDQFKRRLKRVRENHEKANRRLAGHGMRRTG